MAIKIYEQFAPFANPADGDYPYGSIKNDSIPGAEDGTPLDAEWGNDMVGFTDALLSEAGIVPNGQPDTVGNSQRVNAIKLLIDAQYTTVAELATGKFQIGQYVRLTDRSMGLFVVLSGGTPDGFGTLDAGNGNSAGIVTDGGYVNSAWFGAVGDGSDETGAFSAARASSVNVFIPPAPVSYNINSDFDGNFYSFSDIKFTGSGFISCKNLTETAVKKVRCIAHRAYNIPVENTISAIDIATRSGADMLELDVQITSDGIPVLFHDLNLSLRTNGTGSVKDNTFATINGLTFTSMAGTPFSDIRIPTLNAALEHIRKSKVKTIIEIKGYRTLDDIDLILSGVVSYGMSDFVALAVNSEQELARIRTSTIDYGKKCTIFIAYADQNTWRAALQAANEYGGDYEFVMYHVNISGGGQNMVNTINQYSRLSAYWLTPSGSTNANANSAQIASNMLSLGVDSLITDFKINYRG